MFYSKHLQQYGNQNITLGEVILTGYGLFKEKYWFWIGVGALFGYTIVLNILFTLFLTLLNRKCILSFEGQSNMSIVVVVLTLRMISPSQQSVLCKLLCPKMKFGTGIQGGRMAE
jgi:hypothetical protein